MIRELAALFFLVAPPTAQAIFVVDAADGPGTDFTSIADAVAAASDGDTLLMRTGLYDAVEIDDKELALIADVGQTVEFIGSVAVTNLAAGKDMTFTGLALRTQALGPSFAASDCAGSITLQDCEIRIQQTGIVSSGDAARVTDCAAVNFTRCDIVGAVDLVPFGNGEGLELTNSDVSLYDCTLSGPTGKPGSSFDGQPGEQGGAGIRIDGGSLFVSGTTSVGGEGGEGTLPGPFGGGFCSDGGLGGAGLELVGNPTVRVLDSSFVGGPPGLAVDENCIDGVAGPGIQGTGNLQALSASARQFVATTPLRDDETFSATIHGKEGDVAFAFYAHNMTPISFLPEANGPLWPDVFTLQSVFLGTIPASGELETSSTVVFNGTYVEFLIQGLLVDAVDGFVLTNLESVFYVGV